jgi:outer membrane protein OmpA-like peptidoglycan-associated protein
MEQSSVKDKHKEASVKDQHGKEPSVSHKDGFPATDGQEEQTFVEPEPQMTRSQLEAEAFQLLNQELAFVEDNFVLDAEGKATLNAIRNGIGKVNT